MADMRKIIRETISVGSRIAKDISSLSGSIYVKTFTGCLDGIIGHTFNHLYSCDIDGKTGFVEDNDLWIGPHDKGINSMTEQEFNDVISKIETIYKPLVREKGGDLHVERKWEDGTVNASAQRFGGKWVVNMYGALPGMKQLPERVLLWLSVMN